MKNALLFFLVVACQLMVTAQSNRWQQSADYTMKIDMNVETNQFDGWQLLEYTNNSDDTLFKVFYHLYFNAFQPGSMMDVRSRTISDPDRRVGDRIAGLSPEEIGFQKIKSLKQNGKSIDFDVVGTILEVALKKPLLPHTTTKFEMEFLGQVPKQIRRSGRDNKEGIRYSMTQWYPKMCEYDYEGWHSNPYIGREFHGIWGNFDVSITIDSSYVIGATGDLQNPGEIGKGYGVQTKTTSGNKLTWHWKATMVHDFAWAADPDYKHTTIEVDKDLTLHFLYQDDSLTKNWKDLPQPAKGVFSIMNKRFGRYPYKNYTVIQGGDGGMEYPMITLITGNRKINSLIGVTAHEAIHSWYQGLLANNEAKYPYMDEGFTTYAEDIVLNQLFTLNKDNPHESSYGGYFRLVASGKQEPLTTHADHYKTNRAYGTASYSMGAMMLAQLEYVIGSKDMASGMKRYFETWKFKHPNPNDFKRIMEKTSGLELDWYFEHYIGTTNHIDYGIKQVNADNNRTYIDLERIGAFPMPIEVSVELTSGKMKSYYIPMEIMRGAKTFDGVTAKDWPWTYPTYRLLLEGIDLKNIKTVVIDPSGRLADIDKSNNTWEAKNAGSLIFKN